MAMVRQPPRLGDVCRSGIEEMTLYTRFGIALWVALLVGCDRSANDLSPRQAYVIALYDDSVALTEAGEKWGRAMEPWFHGSEANIDELVAADQNFVTAIESVRSKFKKREVPDGSKSKEFAALVAAYLDWQMQTREKYAAWQDIVQAENPAVVATRQSIINELNALNDEELEWKARINSLGEELGVTVGPEP